MAYTQGRLQTQKRKLDGAYFKDVHKQEKQKQQGDYTKGYIEIWKRKDGGGLHPEVFTNMDKKSGRGPITCSIMEMLILVVTYTYINRLSYLTLDKVVILNATQICGINNNMQIKT